MPLRSLPLEVADTGNPVWVISQISGALARTVAIAVPFPLPELTRRRISHSRNAALGTAAVHLVEMVTSHMALMEYEA